MKLVTIQSKKILQPLITNKIHIADFYYIFDKIEEDSSVFGDVYQFIMWHYGYKQPPIFCCVVGRLANFQFTKNCDSMILLELDVPDKLVSLQSFDGWDDIIWYMDKPSRYTKDIPFDEYVESILNGLNVEKEDTVVQATIPCIDLNWVQNVYEVDKSFMDLFDGKVCIEDISTYDLKLINFKELL